MTAYSMTGFGRAELSDELGSVTVEIKSVNNRFKDFRFRLPGFLSSIEIILRKKIEAQFKRGSFEVSINYKKSQTSLEIHDLDEGKVKAFLKETKGLVEDVGGQFVVNPVDFLKDYFKLERTDNEVSSVIILATKTFDLALLELQNSREEEGDKLVDVIRQHLNDYKSQTEVVRSSSGEFESVVKDRLNKKFEKHLAEQDIEKSRFLQEVVYYLERMDICEEINRIDAHLNRLEKLLDRGGEMGRKIDFTIQELNRETNTIGSKSSMDVISESVVQLKLFLEKIREQALNLE